MRQEQGRYDRTREHQQQAGVEEKPARTIKKEEAEMPPAVTPGTEVRRVAAAGEAVAHDQVGAAAELVDKGPKRREVVAVVSIAHDDVAAARRGDAALQCAPVTALAHADHARAAARRDLRRAVTAAVVGDDD